MPVRWGTITANEIIGPIHGAVASGEPGTVLAGISTDSRTTQHGDLFWALIGEKYDGHDFALKALEKGASGIVVQKDRWHCHLFHIGQVVQRNRHPYGPLARAGQVWRLDLDPGSCRAFLLGRFYYLARAEAVATQKATHRRRDYLRCLVGHNSTYLR